MPIQQLRSKLHQFARPATSAYLITEVHLQSENCSYHDCCVISDSPGYVIIVITIAQHGLATCAVYLQACSFRIVNFAAFYQTLNK